MKRPPKIISIAIIASFLAYPVHGHADDVLPQLGDHGSITGGTLDYTHPNTLNVDVLANQGIANWQSYSVGAGHTVNYNRDSSFVFLNRVIGGDPSRIFGNINALNGKIFLVNQNGVLFAPGSHVNAAGLVASTLDIRDSDFLAGRYTFFGRGGSVVNQGIINAPGGYVALLGSAVENAGVIEANLGKVALASGEAMTLSLDPNSVMSVVIDQATTQNLENRDSAVKNTGRITADGGNVILTANTLDGVFRKAANNEGVIEARSLVHRDGKVVLSAEGDNSLVSNTGTIDVSAREAGANGGTIELSAASVDFERGTYRAEAMGGERGKLVLDPWDWHIGDLQAFFLEHLNGFDVTLEAGNDIFFNLGNLGGDHLLDLLNFDTETFTLRAGRHIYLNNDAIATHGGDIRLLADAPTSYGPADGIGSIYLGSGMGLASHGGDISLQGATLDLSAPVNAGSGDVSLTADAGINDSTGNGLVTGNGLTFTAGNLVGAGVHIDSIRIVSGHVVLTIQNRTGASSYTIYGSTSPTGPWTVVGTVTAAAGTQTQWTDPAAMGATGFYRAEVGAVADSSVGTIGRRINTDVNTISGVSRAGTGGIYINEANGVRLSNVRNDQGVIDVVAGNDMVAHQVTTSGNDGDDIRLRTTTGSIEVDTVNAGTHGDVRLTSAAGIHDADGNSAVTGDALTFTAGNLVGTAIHIDGIRVVSGHIVLTLQNREGAATYTIYGATSVTGPWTVVGTVTSAAGAQTQWTDPSAMGTYGFYKAEVGSVPDSSVGTATNRINTNVNSINGVSKAGPGGIYLNEADGVALTTLHNDQGVIDVVAGGDMRAGNVSTSGHAGDNITLTTTSGKIEVDTVNAGRGDVTLTSAGSIDDADANSAVTARNLVFTAGNLVGTGAHVDAIRIVSGHVVLTIRNMAGAASYTIYGSTSPTGPWTVVGTATAAAGTQTQWSDPAAMGATGFYRVEVGAVVDSSVGSAANRINTDVDTITGVSKAGAGDIYLNEANGVRLANIRNDQGNIDVVTGGNMEVDTVNAGTTGNVTLTSAVGIRDDDGNSAVSGDALTFIAGNLAGMPVHIDGIRVVNGHIVLTLPNILGVATYTIYGATSPTGPWTVVGTVEQSILCPVTQWMDPSAMGTYGFYKAEVGTVADSSVGTAANRINTNVNSISGVSKAGPGDIYLNEANGVRLADIRNVQGNIDVIAGGNMEVDTVNAGTTGDVTLTSAGSINDADGNSAVTADNFAFTAGNLAGSGVHIDGIRVVSSHIVLTIQNRQGAATYTIYGATSPAGPWTVVGTATAAAGTQTEWTDPSAMGAYGFYKAEVGAVADSSVGSAAHRINTDVNSISGVSKAGPGDIYLNEANGVRLANIRNDQGNIDVVTGGAMEVDRVNAGTTGDVTLTSASGIHDADGNSAVTANNLALTAGNLVGTGAHVDAIRIVSGHVVLTIQNRTGATSYTIYGSTSPTGPWTIVGTATAAAGSQTQWTDPAAMGATGFYRVEVGAAADTSIGDAGHRINTDVNTITALSKQGQGNIYLNEANGVTLANVRNDQGLVDVVAGGDMRAGNVSTSGRVGDDIRLTTNLGNIEVDTVNAGTQGNVRLSSAGSINDADGNSAVTGNSLAFTAGNLVGTGVHVDAIRIVSGHVVLTIQNRQGAATYTVFGSTSPTGPWTPLATVVPAAGATTQWTDPAAMGATGFYKVEVGSVPDSAVGSALHPINTNVNTISGVSNAGPGGIFLNEANGVTLSNIRNDQGDINVVAGNTITVGSVNGTNVSLDAVNGSILGAGNGTHITSLEDTRLHAGGVVGSWDPYEPLNVNVGRDLFVGMDGTDGTASGSVGQLGVSGALGGTVGGTYHFIPGTITTDPATGTFTLNPPGYIFLNQNEIWPSVKNPNPNPNPTPFDRDALLRQISLDPRARNIYNPNFRTVFIDPATATGVYFYHPLTPSDFTAYDNITLDTGAYDYIQKKEEGIK